MQFASATPCRIQCFSWHLTATSSRLNLWLSLVMCSLTGDSGRPCSLSRFGTAEQASYIWSETWPTYGMMILPFVADPVEIGSEERVLGRDRVATFQAFLVYPETLITFFKCHFRTLRSHNVFISIRSHYSDN